MYSRSVLMSLNSLVRTLNARFVAVIYHTQCVILLLMKIFAGGPISHAYTI